MDWLKKKKDEAKQAASVAAAKMQNKRSAFKGEGNVLGGDIGSNSTSSAAATAASAPATTGSASISSDLSGAHSDSASTSSTSSSTRAFKVPSFSKATKSPPKPLSEDEKREQRDARLKALEERTGAWDKRVATARKARLQQEASLENKFASSSSGSSSSLESSVAPAAAAAAAASSSSSSSMTSEPAPRVLTTDEMRAFELESAHASVGFNPYAVVMASSTEASTALQYSGSQASQLPPPPPSSVQAQQQEQPQQLSTAAAATGRDAVTDAADDDSRSSAVYVLLRQEPARAIVAAETILKVLDNVLQHPQEDKFRKIRLTNASIQTKLVAVRGAVELLCEAGFAQRENDNESWLVLDAATVAVEQTRIQNVRDRTEVALIQLQVDSAAL